MYVYGQRAESLGSEPEIPLRAQNIFSSIRLKCKTFGKRKTGVVRQSFVTVIVNTEYCLPFEIEQQSTR